MATINSETHAGRVALVTGASRGIGQAIATGLAERGAQVVLGGHVDDVSETTDRIAKTGRRALTVALDVSDPSSIAAARDRVMSELGRVDILVDNAGMFEAATWDELDYNLWQRVMAVDLNGPMLMCKAFLPLIRGRGWGRVINVGSATVAIASPVSIAYRTAKMGVVGFTRALAATLGDEGITINVVLPSLTKTAMSEGLPEAIVKASLGRQVIHREAEPADIAGSVFLLAADEAGWITGQTIMANGGNAFALFANHPFESPHFAPPSDSAETGAAPRPRHCSDDAAVVPDRTAWVADA